MSKLTKQVIVVRKDLNMSTGKMCAQVAHASMKALLDRSKFDKYNKSSYLCWFEIDESESLFEWLRNSFTKIVVYVNNEAELLEVYDKAKNHNILTSLIIDEGRTEFHGARIKTAAAVGPDWSSKIDEITGHLPLL